MKRFLIPAVLAFGALGLLGTTGDRAGAGDPPRPVPTVVTTAPASQVVVSSAHRSPSRRVRAVLLRAGCFKKVCVPDTGIKTTKKIVYGSACEDFCLPKCSLFGHCGHSATDCCACQGDGSCPQCEHRVYQHKYLVVKKIKCEKPVNKCRVELQQAGCPMPCTMGMPIQVIPGKSTLPPAGGMMPPSTSPAQALPMGPIEKIAPR